MFVALCLDKVDHNVVESSTENTYAEAYAWITVDPDNLDEYEWIILCTITNEVFRFETEKVVKLVPRSK